MRRERNGRTQPFLAHRIFQNWDVIAKAWYVTLPSAALKVGDSKGFDIGNQHLVLYRGEDGVVRCLDGFCPHMGTDLAIGKVRGNDLRCFFHHWRFDGEGKCVDIPCGEKAPAGARLRSYATEERYGFIWVWPESRAPAPVSGWDEFAGLTDRDLEFRAGRPYERTCHHHVTMINGIDPQHLRTVHDLQIDMDLRIVEAGDIVDYSLRGEIPAASLAGRVTRRLLGDQYGYAMRYQGGTLGFLTLNQHTRLFGGGRRLPELRMIFAYRPVSRGRTLVQPIYVTRKRRGLLGKLKENILLELTRRAFYALQGEDGKVYENMRFNPTALLLMDRPVASFIKAINRLEPSTWSTVMTPAVKTRAGAESQPVDSPQVPTRELPSGGGSANLTP